MDKRKVLIITLAAIFLLSATYLLVPSKLKLSWIIIGKINDDYLAEEKPQGTFSNMSCPNDGSNLSRIVIDPDDPNILDEAWRVAYYCKQEDVFWIIDGSGWTDTRWYGPFDTYWKLTNIAAVCGIIFSGTVLALITFRGKVKLKK